MGFTRQAMIGIRCQGDTTEIAERLALIDSVAYVVLTAGGFDIITEVVCSDDEELLEMHQHRNPGGTRSGHHRNAGVPETR